MEINNLGQQAGDIAISPQKIWGNRIRERKQSGKSIRQYCAEEGIKEWQYYQWQHKLQPSIQPAKGFVELKTKPLLGRIVVELGGCRMEVERDFDAVTFKEIVSVLRTI